MEALEFLQALVDLPLCYGLKYSDTELYELGFGKMDIVTTRYGNEKKVCTHILHILCRFKVIWKNGERKVDKYYEDTPSEKFHSEAERIVGLKVRRVALSDKNDLWLDLDDCWIVFATSEDGEESWRFFTSNEDATHLVASDSWVYFI